ncbi:peptidylprolyl isomerase [Rapidithrix thailandica]|uniref:Peptidyl-prolyl cis-trans isomerase n=1 Tax=Rapidithrix thailandica TaxID=413964 RepID=A0AAW9RVJ4_9BACT
MQAKDGDKVKVHYVGTLNDGEVFDSSVARNQPIEFTLGAGQMIKGFEKAVLGMQVSEKKTVTIPCDEAYGPSSEENVVNFPKENLPADMNPKVGDQLTMNSPEGQQIPVVVKEVTEDLIVLDANHVLAGKDLTFEIELVEIEG